jgi:hypothetical protein
MLERPSTPLRRASSYSCWRVRLPLLPARLLLPREALGLEDREDEDFDEEDFVDDDGRDEDDFEADGFDDDFDREDDLREPFVSPASARSLFTVRAAISSARRPCPRFS